MYKLLLSTIIAIIPISLAGQENCYQQLKAEAYVLYKKKKYESAINKYLAALNCDSINQNELAALIKKAQRGREQQLILARDSAILAKNQADEQRIKAEMQTLRVISNDLTYKSQQAEDRAVAFRLLEMAINIDPKNTQALQQLINIHYIDKRSYHFNLYGHEGELLSSMFSNDGKRVVTASKDSTAIIWDYSGRMLFVLNGHKAEVNLALFSPDDEKVITASRDSTIKIWDSNTGTELLTFKGHESPISSIACSPDNK